MDNMNTRSINGFTLQLMAENVWAIDEFGIVQMYLIIGSKKALLFDTGLGLGEIEVVVREMTELPLFVVNSHSHYDHSGGNSHFDVIYAQKDAVSLLREQENTEYRRLFCGLMESHPEFNHQTSMKAYLNRVGSYDIIEIAEGRIFDLGDRKLEVIETPGHTKDGICLLDAENRLLFTADTVMSEPVLMLDSTTLSTVTEYHASLKKLESRQGEYDLLFPGHLLRPLSKKYLYDLIICTEKILENPSVGEPLQSRLAQSPSYRYTYGASAITYTLNRV